MIATPHSPSSNGLPLRLAMGLVLLLSSCSARADEVVARAGGVDYGAQEVRAYVEALAPTEREALGKDPALLAKVVRSFVTRSLVLKEAQAKKWDQQPGVKAQLDRAREEALVELYLTSVARPAEGYPSEAEVQAAYEARKPALQVPRQLRLAQVFVAAAPGGDKAAEEKGRKKAEELGRRLRQKDADFAAVARAESEDRTTAPAGGEIGWTTEAQLVPAVRQGIAGLAAGAVSGPIRADDGWHVVKVLAEKPAGVRTLDEVREPLVQQLRAERARAERQRYLEQLVARNPPAINELALSRVLSR